MNRLETMSAAVRTVIDGYPVGHRFHGNELKDDVVKIFPEAKDMYTDTIQRMMRRHRRESYKTVDQNKSLYEKVYAKPFIERIKEAMPVKKPEPAQKDDPAGQLGIFGWL